jgi:TonB family protein
MKRLQIVGERLPACTDSSPSDKRALLKTGVFSLFLHIVFIMSLILYLKTGITKSDSILYRVTIRPLSPQNILNPYSPQGLPTPQPPPAKTQIQKEEKKLEEKIKSKEPLEEPKLPPQYQEDEKIITKPIPLPMASKPSLDSDSNLEKDENLAIPLAPSPEENNKNVSGGSIAEQGSGAGIGSSVSGGSGEGQGTGQDGSRWGGPGEGKGRGSSGWAGLGKEPGTGRRVPGLRGSGKGTGTGRGGHLGGSGVASPRYGENPKPVYPLEARQKGHEGEVILKVEVLPNGRVGEVQVDKSSGYETLDHSAVETVKKWKFIPAKKGGVAIPCWVNIPFKFQLRDVPF